MRIDRLKIFLDSMGGGAVKKLVVGYLTWWAWPCVTEVMLCAGLCSLLVLPLTCRLFGVGLECGSDIAFAYRSSFRKSVLPLIWSGRQSWSFTLKKLECLRQAYAVNILAWNNKIGLRHRWWLLSFCGNVTLLCFHWELRSNSCRSLFCWFLELK